MPVRAVSAAKKLCAASDWTLSNLELQKILYLAHMFYIGRTGNKLIREYFEAWDYGPVVPSLYHKMKIFGRKPIRDIFQATPDVLPGDRESILQEAFDGLGDMSIGQLVAITHWEEGAWSKNYSPGSRGTIIPNDDICAEYAARKFK